VGVSGRLVRSRLLRRSNRRSAATLSTVAKLGDLMAPSPPLHPPHRDDELLKRPVRSLPALPRQCADILKRPFRMGGRSCSCAMPGLEDRAKTLMSFGNVRASLSAYRRPLAAPYEKCQAFFVSRRLRASDAGLILSPQLDRQRPLAGARPILDKRFSALPTRPCQSLQLVGWPSAIARRH